MVYETAFDVLETGYRQWWFPVLGVATAVCISMLARQFGKADRSRAFSGGKGVWKTMAHGTLSPRALLAIGLIIAAGMFYQTYSDYVQLRDALRNGNYSSVEGRVTEYIPAGPGERPSERFVVEGHRYQYSFADVAAGFNQSARRGGPIRPGLQVRIADVDGRIARLEIAK